ncbi:MAG: hypothetical protein MJ095_01500 [Oscillospiraceae bacterium]|nr:hypothetical protein [Oscillospiraceae bacterium]
MPICQIKTNYRFSDEGKKNFLNHMNSELAVILDKPLPAVMSMLSDEYMYMNSSDDTVVFAEFRYLKDFSSAEEKSAFLKDFSDRALRIFQEHTSVNPYRVYMQFTEMTREGAWRYTG